MDSWFQKEPHQTWWDREGSISLLKDFFFFFFFHFGGMGVWRDGSLEEHHKTISQTEQVCNYRSETKDQLNPPPPPLGILLGPFIHTSLYQTSHFLFPAANRTECHNTTTFRTLISLSCFFFFFFFLILFIYLFLFLFFIYLFIFFIFLNLFIFFFYFFLIFFFIYLFIFFYVISFAR